MIESGVSEGSSEEPRRLIEGEDAWYRWEDASNSSSSAAARRPAAIDLLSSSAAASAAASVAAKRVRPRGECDTGIARRPAVRSRRGDLLSLGDREAPARRPRGDLLRLLLSLSMVLLVLLVCGVDGAAGA